MSSPEPARDSGWRSRTGTQIASQHGALWVCPLPGHPHGTSSGAPSLPAWGTLPQGPEMAAGSWGEDTGLLPQAPDPLPLQAAGPEHTGRGPWGAPRGCGAAEAATFRPRPLPAAATARRQLGNAQAGQTSGTIPALSTDSPGFGAGGGGCPRTRTRAPSVSMARCGPILESAKARAGSEEAEGGLRGGGGERGTSPASLSLSLFFL